MKIPVAHGELEAHLRPAEGPARGAAVVCHPHPEHGGTMHTKAVFRAAQTLSEIGFETLRFNFRGVGTSTGSYDEGVGEQEDVRAALEWLEETHPDQPLLVAGFSFGSRVGLTVGAGDPRVTGLFGMGLAVRLWDFSFLEGIEKPLLVVQGEEDQFGSGSEAEELVQRLNGPVTLVRIPGSDHFFTDRIEELQDAVRDYFTRGPGADAFPARAST